MELADQGTLFLDEVGDIPVEIQPKLLRALQEREFERLGSTNTRRVNIRLNRATFLSQMKKFGIDLALAYYDVAGNASQAGRAWTQLLTAKKSGPYRSRISTQNRGNSTLAMELYYEALKLDPIDVTSHQQSRNPLGKVRTVSRGRKSFAEDL
jgi:hypothetical protein